MLTCGLLAVLTRGGLHKRHTCVTLVSHLCHTCVTRAGTGRYTIVTCGLLAVLMYGSAYVPCVFSA
eukprot:6469068-Pyramimonas_sp.AAC.1